MAKKTTNKKYEPISEELMVDLKKRMDELQKILTEKVGGTPYFFINYTKEDRSIIVKNGAPDKIAEAIFTNIIVNGKKNGAASEIYRIVKDVLLNLFMADDEYRRDFVKDMMTYCAADQLKN